MSFQIPCTPTHSSDTGVLSNKYRHCPNSDCERRCLAVTIEAICGVILANCTVLKHVTTDIHTYSDQARDLTIPLLQIGNHHKCATNITVTMAQRHQHYQLLQDDI